MAQVQPYRPQYKQLPLTRRFWRAIRQYWPLYVMLIPGMLFFLVYKYAPMYGIQIAFKNYSLKKGISGSPWLTETGKPLLYWFQRFFKTPQSRQIISNTLVLSLSKLLVGMLPPLIFALAISECSFKRYSRVIQTVSYLPHFLSWVIIYGICATMLGETSGVINNLFKKLGWNTVPFLNSSKYIRGVLVGSSLWQSIGWSSIVYLAAIAGIDTSMYEAATIDGCGRFRQIWYNPAQPGPHLCGAADHQGGQHPGRRLQPGIRVYERPRARLRRDHRHLGVHAGPGQGAVQSDHRRWPDEIRAELRSGAGHQRAGQKVG